MSLKTIKRKRFTGPKHKGNTCDPYEDDSDTDETVRLVKRASKKLKSLGVWAFMLPLCLIVIGFLMYTCIVFYSQGMISYRNHLYKAQKKWDGYRKYLKEDICANDEKRNYYENTIDHKKCDDARKYLKWKSSWHALSMMASETKIAEIYNNIMNAVSNVVDAASNKIYLNIIVLVFMALTLWSVVQGLVPAIFNCAFGNK